MPEEAAADARKALYDIVFFVDANVSDALRDLLVAFDNAFDPFPAALCFANSMAAFADSGFFTTERGVFPLYLLKREGAVKLSSLRCGVLVELN